jgi:hypothetical protein
MGTRTGWPLPDIAFVSGVQGDKPHLRQVTTIDEAIAYAFDLLDVADGYAAHEVLEPWWLLSRAEGREVQTQWLHALIKLGACQVKVLQGNARGTRSHWEQVSSLLAQLAPSQHHDVAIAHLHRLGHALQRMEGQ